jgi:hypothetical protein
MNTYTPGIYEVFYDAVGYKSSTRVEALNEQAAMDKVSDNFPNCMKITHVIVIKKSNTDGY